MTHPPCSGVRCDHWPLQKLRQDQSASKAQRQYGSRYSNAGWARTFMAAIRKEGLRGMRDAQGVHQRTPDASCKKRLTAYRVPLGRPPASRMRSPLVRMTSSSSPRFALAACPKAAAAAAPGPTMMEWAGACVLVYISKE